MPPAPNVEHQDLEGELQAYLKKHWAAPVRAKVYHQVNLASTTGWPDDFRIPDLVLLTRGRKHINRGEYLAGAPDVVVEIQSPGDETRDKLPFYAELGVPEVWIIDRDSKQPEVHVLRGGRYRRQRPAAGWHRSPATGVEMRAQAGKLLIQIGGDETSREQIPQD